MFEISFFVEGHPAAQGSKRHVGGGRMIEMSKYLPAWREEVKGAARRCHMDDGPYDGPVSVAITVYLAAPKKSRFGEYPAGPPDADKLARAIGDALTQSGVIKDDARIVDLHITKRWADGGPPGASITIRPI